MSKVWVLPGEGGTLRMVFDPGAPLAEAVRCAGVARDVLEGRIAALVATLEAERRDAADLSANLTATQARCTELKLELRAYRASGICLPGWTCCHCGGFNGAARETLSRCRSCGEPRPS